MELCLGNRRYDLTQRCLVMGILNRTRDSFFDGGDHFQFDRLLRRADELVAGGADILDVGARPGGVGVRHVSEQEEAELAASAISALRRRFDVALSVDTWRSGVAAACFRAGAVVGNDMSGFSDPRSLAVAGAAGAAVVATHMRGRPGVAEPDPHYDDPVGDVAGRLRALASRAMATGIPPERVMVDPGLDLGKSWRQSLELLRASSTFAGLGHPVLVAPSNKIFLGRVLHLERDERLHATVAACALAVDRGARVVRVHDARSARHAVDPAIAFTGSGIQASATSVVGGAVR